MTDRNPESTHAAKLEFRREVAQRRARRTGQPSADATKTATPAESAATAQPAASAPAEPADYPAHWTSTTTKEGNDR